MTLNKRISTVIAAAFLIGAVSAQAEDVKFDWSSIRPGVTLKTWLLNDTTTSAVPGSQARPNFRVRRAEVRLAGTVTERANWFVMADFAKLVNTTIAPLNDRSFLQDVGATYSVCSSLDLTVGQFRVLTDSEGLEKEGELLLPERSVGARVFGERREPGAMLMFHMEHLQVGGMISNGTGPNADDFTNAKDLSFRADYDVTDQIRVGAYTQSSDFGYAVRGSTGLNARLIFNDLLVSAEGIVGTVGGNTADALVGNVAYMITPMWQPVLRAEFHNPNTTGPSVAQAYTVGLNYYVSRNNAKIQAAYSYMLNLASPNGTSQYQDGLSGSNAILAFQAAL